MTLTQSEWHTRFLQQAVWTKAIRQFLLNRLQSPQVGRILEVGCGTGALLEEFTHKRGDPGYKFPALPITSGELHGLDINYDFLYSAAQLAPITEFTQGDALALPYANDVFDLSYCHFLLLWVNDPQRAVDEMARVTCPYGYVIAFAEPDYGGRIDFPTEFEILGALQREALSKQGANPSMGRQLSKIFRSAGLVNVETGVLGGQWKVPPSQEQLELEWLVLFNDLENLMPSERLKELQLKELSAWERGERILYVPTFYTIGQVQQP